MSMMDKHSKCLIPSKVPKEDTWLLKFISALKVPKIHMRLGKVIVLLWALFCFVWLWENFLFNMVVSKINYTA